MTDKRQQWEEIKANDPLMATALKETYKIFGKPKFFNYEPNSKSRKSENAIHPARQK